jgi:hypothetical protein
VRKHLGTILLLAIMPTIGAFVSCGGQIESNMDDAIDASSPAIASDAGTTSSIGFDSGTGLDIDGGAGFPPVDGGPDDRTTACASRGAIDCSCHTEDCPPGDQVALSILVSNCNGDAGDVCGNIYVDFDPNGCATALRMNNPNPKFVACMTDALDTQRWPCAMSSGGSEVMTNVDCTTP